MTANTSSHITQIQAFNDDGAGGVKTDVSAPVFSLANEPTGLTLSDVYSSSVTLTWGVNDNSSSTRYEVSLSPDGFTSYFSTPVVLAAGLTANTTAIVGLMEGTTYSFRVRAYNGDDVASNFSATTNTVTQTIAPTAVTDLAASVTNATLGAVTLTWTAPSDLPGGVNVSKYIVRYATFTSASVGGTDTWWGLATDVRGEPAPAVPSSTELFVLSGLPGGQSLTFHVRSTDTANNLSAVDSGTEQTVSLPAHVVISKLRYGSGGLDFVELYNPTANPIDLQTLPLNFHRRTSAGGDSNVPLTFVNPTIPSKGFFLIAPDDTVTGGVSPDATTGGADLYSGSNSVYICSSATALTDIIDVLATGSGTDTNFVDFGDPNAPARIGNPASGQGLMRLPSNGVGHSTDTNKWQSDFVSTATPVAHNSLSGAEPDQGAPAAISDLTALAGAEGIISLSWTSPGDDGVSGGISGGAFILKYTTMGIINDFSSPPSPAATVNLSTTAAAGSAQVYVLSDLIRGASYWFAIAAQDELANQSVWTSSGTNPAVNTQAFAVAYDAAPSSPTAVTIQSRGPTFVQLTWTAPTPDPGDITGYEIYYDTDAAGAPYDGTGATDGASPISLGSVTNYVLTGLQINATYYIALKTVDAGPHVIRSDFSSEVSTYTELALPGAPATFTGAAQSNTSIWWECSLVAGATSYELQTSTGGVVVSLAHPTTAYLQTGLTANTSSYIAQVQTRNEAGAGGITPAAGTPVYTLANQPTALTLSNVHASSVTLTWNANGNSPSTRYEVSLSSDGFTSYFSTPVALSANLTANTTALLGLAESTAYSFRVRAYNGDDIPGTMSAATNTVTQTLAPNAVTDLAASVTDAFLGAVTLTWTAPSDAPSGAAASKYIVRYATFTAASVGGANTWWSLATDVPGEPTPAAPSSGELFTLSGLPSGQSVTFHIRSTDTANNLSAVDSGTEQTVSVPAHIMFSQVKRGGTAASSFVELYNPSNSSVNLSAGSVYLHRRSNAGTDVGSRIQALTGTIPAKGFYLIADSTDATSGVALDFEWDTAGDTLSLANVTLYLSQGLLPLIDVIDVLAMGNPSTDVNFIDFGDANAPVRLSTPTSNLAAVRRPAGGAGHATDSNKWQSDFLNNQTPNPRNTSSPAEPNDPPTAPVVTYPNGGESFIQGNGITVTWTAATDPESATLYYDVDYSLNNGGAWVDISSGVAATSLAWTLPMTTSIQALVRVRAWDGVQFGNFDQSDANFSIVTDTIPPAAISDLAAVAGSAEGQIALSWTSPGDDDISGTLTGGEFLVKYSSVQIIRAADFASPPFAHTALAISTSGVNNGNAQYRLISNLTPGSTYWFAIKTRDEQLGNYSVWNSSGDNASVNTLAWAAAPDLPPGAPVISAVAAVNRQISVTWSPPSPDPGDIASYTVLWATYSTFNGAGEPNVSSTSVSSPALSTAVPANNGYPYYFKVQAVDGPLGGAQAGSASAISAEARPRIRPPTGVAGAHTGSSVNLSWTASPDAGVSNCGGYNLYRSTVSGTGYAYLANLAAAAVSYVDSSSISATQTYYYVLRTSDTDSATLAGYAESADSNEAAAQSDVTAPLIAHSPVSFLIFNGSAPLTLSAVAVDYRDAARTLAGTVQSMTLYVGLSTAATAYTTVSFSGSGFGTSVASGTAAVSVDFLRQAASFGGFSYYLTATDGVNTAVSPPAPSVNIVTVDSPAGRDVGPEGGVVTTPGGFVEVVITTNALTGTVSITANPLDSATLPIGLAADGIPIRDSYTGRPLTSGAFGPDGLTFRVAVKIRLKYLDTDGDGYPENPPGGNAYELPNTADFHVNNLKIFWLSGGRWVLMGGKREGDRIVVNTTHFSTYALFPAGASGVKTAERFVTPNHDGVNDYATFGTDAVRVTIYDMTGKEMWSATGDGLTAIQWPGTDSDGNVLESGAYIYKAEGSGGSNTHGVVVIAK
ncbi:MAG TPA: fibronectin type III domain-containing protein [Elusimicrobiota bacterium]|nr:fibronectin type III domain-containing protein [Elusimicrobiota bacterium]